MTKFSDLIAKYCPDGVEYVKLGDLCDMRNGYTPSKKNPGYWREAATIPWFRMEDIRVNGHILNDSIQHVTPEAVKGGKLFPANSIILATTATIGEHALITADSLANQQFTYLTIRELHREHILPMFLYYYMYIVDEQCKHNINESSFASVNMTWLKSVPIPLPPLPVQEKIVEILDKFTALQTALQTELDLRKQQYEYYRDKLLSHEYLEILPGGYREIELGDVGAIRMCKRILKNQTNKNGGIPFYKIGSFGGETDNYISQELFDEYRNKYPYPNKGDLLISAAGTIGKIVVFDGEPSYFQDSNIVWLDNDNSILSNHYLYYLYQTIEWKVSTGGTIARLYNSAIASQKVVIPNSLSEQHRIADILDKFNALATSLIDGLPAEIELRQKQYEYYRDQLLTFKQKH